VPHESPRIAELRRRVHADPASIAFAQLAEEYRRAGQYQEAVTYCRAGLSRHPGYLSARVTLGRSLTELGELEDALREFALVLRSAPDNLAAIRSTAEIHQRRGDMEAALEYYTRGLALARFDPELEESVNRIAREMGRVGAVAPGGLSFEQASSELLSAASRLPAEELFLPEGQGPASPAGEPVSEPPLDFDALLASFGVPDASPPRATERLIADPPLASELVEPSPPKPTRDPPEPTIEAVPGDPFAALEHELRAFADRSVAADLEAESHDSMPPKEHFDDRVVAELEGWLRVLTNDSAAAPEA
jgi:tetratricopeptide (TPR) repeat protein